MGMVLEQVQQRFLAQPNVRERLPELKQRVISGDLPATTAARDLLSSLDSLFEPVKQTQPKAST
jgi:hypothetical protein